MKHIIIAALALAACGGQTGTMTLTTWGEDYIEQQIPATAFADSAEVRFSKFLVVLRDIEVATSDGEVADVALDPLVVDVHQPGPHTLTTLTDIPAQRWDAVGVTLAPASEASALNASAADVDLMTSQGYSVYVEGSATLGGDSYSFAWGFTTATRYSDCTESSGGAGAVVPAGGSVTVELTVHGDHLFYDDLQSEDPSLRLAALAAADADSDSDITLAELAAVDLTTLPLGQYGTGGDGSVGDLRAFVTALTRTLVHFQGEGHCHSHVE